MAQDKDKPARPKPPVALAQTGLMPTTLDETWRLAEAIGRVVVPDGAPAERAQAAAIALVKITSGMEIGFKPMYSARAMQAIADSHGNLTVTLSAEAMRALIMASDTCLGFVIDVEGEGDGIVATAKGVRVDVKHGQRIETSAKRTARFIDYKATMTGRKGLKYNWKHYPDDMCVARATTKLAKALWPDIIAGLRSQEEVEDWPEREIRDVQATTMDGAAALSEQAARLEADADADADADASPATVRDVRVFDADADVDTGQTVEAEQTSTPPDAGGTSGLPRQGEGASKTNTLLPDESEEEEYPDEDAGGDPNNPWTGTIEG